MPPVSQAQRKWAWANKDKNTKEGKAAAEFAKADPGGKLPAHKKGAVDRSAHWKGNPGFPSSEAGGSPPPKTYQHHENREKEVMGAGYEQHEAGWGKSSHNFQIRPATNAHLIGTHKREGHLRLSGHKGAHRIGKR